MKIVTVNIPESFLDAIEKLVGENGLYPSRSELIRVAVRDFLLRELKMADNKAKYKEEKVEEFDEDNYVKVPVERLNEKDEPIREFKTYKIIKRLSYDDPLEKTKIDCGEFTGKVDYNQRYDDIPLPANYDPPSIDEQRTMTPDESFVKFINEV